ncbi:MAG: hypothetical protein E7277_08715, partial [Lachnospiraceae bacterium]|nr:hypothetical protein [Lachnospiraceae bacterium]
MKGVRKKILIPLTVFAVVAFLSAILNIVNFNRIKKETVKVNDEVVFTTIALDELTQWTDKIPKHFILMCLKQDMASDYENTIFDTDGDFDCIDYYMKNLKEYQSTAKHK